MDGRLLLALILVCLTLGLTLLQRRVARKTDQPDLRTAAKEATPGRLRLTLLFFGIFFVGTLVIGYVVNRGNDFGVGTLFVYLPALITLGVLGQYLWFRYRK